MTFRLTQKVFYDLAIWMVVLGLSIGIVFPYFVVILGVPQDIALKPIFFIACLSAGALAGILNYMVARGVVGARLKVLAHSMHHIEQNLNTMTATGDFSKCTPDNCFISVDSEDEIGESAQAFNGLVESLSISFKTHEAVRSFSEMLTCHLDIKGLSENALLHFFEHTNTSAGLILFEVHGGLQCAASHGLRNPDEILASDHIINAMQTGQRQAISTPEGVQIDGVLTDFLAGEVVVAPLMYKNMSIGAVVLANKDTYNPNDISRIDLFVKGLGLALNNALAHDSLKKMAVRDPLTGVYNRRFGFDRLQEEFSKAVRCGSPLGVLIFDLDNFKKINDTYGHSIGDSVLKSISEIAQSVLRENDILFRYGGEEFVIVLPGAPEGELRIIGERLRNIIEQSHLSEIHATLRTTVSIGGSAFHHDHTESEHMLIRLADEALYRAKTLGRNRVEIAK